MKKIYKTGRKIALMLGFLSLSQLNAQSPYCASAAIVSADEEIYNVMVNGNNTNPAYSFLNGCTTPAPGPGSQLSLYSNFRTLGTFANIIPGVVSTFSIQENECDGATFYPCGMSIWIDYNQNGLFTDPGEQIFVEPNTITGPRTVNGTFIVPLTASTGTTVMRVLCAEGYSGASLTPCLSYGYGETEDYVVNVIPPTPCSGTPGPNAVVAPTLAICPNASAFLTLANSYTTIGITYSWMASSTSSLGPWTVALNNFTNTTLSTPQLTTNTWFRLQADCPGFGTSLFTAPAQVSVQPITLSTVPYFEGFEGISQISPLPNCSWISTGGNAQTYLSPQTNGRVPRSGGKFAAVYGYNLNGTNYYYTNGIQMYSGITYSASVWFMTDYYGYSNFTEFSILRGTTQTPTGLVNIATYSPAVSPSYKQLANTFTVPSSGVYYIAIKVVSSANNNYAYYLSWDDLSITIPCQLNTPAVSVNATSSVICSGQSANLTATGADTYVWSNGANTSAVTEPLFNNTQYSVIGTNTITGCSSTVVQNIIVNQTPQVSIAPSATAVCAGQSINLVAIGATNYTWAPSGSNAQGISVSPTQATTYSVIGTFGGNNNCSGSAIQAVNVNQAPTVNAGNVPAASCAGQAVNLTATGTAINFTWTSNSSYLQGSQVTVFPSTNTTYTLTGADGNGCTATANVVQSVFTCVGINQTVASLSGLSVYPNPNNGEFTVELNNGLNKTVQVFDMTGREVSFQSSSNDKMGVNLSNYANGVYYVKVKSENGLEVIKIVKQ